MDPFALQAVSCSIDGNIRCRARICRIDLTVHAVRGNHMTKDMEADPFNISMRKFLKQVGVTSQQAIEKAVEQKGLRGKGKLVVKAVITSEAAGLHHVVESEIDLG
jgi:hypothetical protein